MTPRAVRHEPFGCLPALVALCLLALGCWLASLVVGDFTSRTDLCRLGIATCAPTPTPVAR